MKNIIKQNKLKLFFDRDRIYLYPWYFAEQCLTDDIEKIFGMKIEKTILEFKKGYLYSYIDTDRGNEIGKFLFEKVKKDKKFYKKVDDSPIFLRSDISPIFSPIFSSILLGGDV